MNKSTPLSELPNLKKGNNSNAYEEKENQIVSEILSEIDNSNKENVSMEINKENKGSFDEQEKQVQQNDIMIEQQRIMDQQILQQKQQMDNNSLENSLNDSVNNSLVNNIINMVRQPIIVAVVIALVSIPQINNIILGFLSGREKLASYSTIILMLFKSILGALMFYGINMNL